MAKAKERESDKESLFSEIVLERGLCTADQLAEARLKQARLVARGTPRRLGEVMMAMGLITKPQGLDVLKECHRRQGKKPRIGGYQLEKLLGRGGMGSVYLAKQVSMDRLVALKLLPRRMSKDRDFVKRFMREARTCARVNHKNIVAAIDFGENNGYNYFAMEYVDGHTVEDELKKQSPLPEDRVVVIALQVVQGLEHAAEQGIIHRDIKPANLMVAKDDVVKIADMGLAISTDNRTGSELTRVGMAVGTPYYMSPEQSEGKHDVDHRADIYALGATLFELATGTKPWDGENVAAIMARRLYEDPPVASEVAPGMSRGLAAVILKMMQRDPAKRYQEHQDLIKDLRKVSTGKPPSCQRLVKPTRSRGKGRKKTGEGGDNDRPRGRTRPRQRQDNSLTALLGVGISLLVLLVVVLLFVLTKRDALRGPRHPAPDRSDPKVWQPFEAPSSPAAAARKAWIRTRNLQHEYDRDGRQPGDARESLRSAYEGVATRHPGTAYAALAKAALEGL